jgi:hypothetical protein
VRQERTHVKRFVTLAAAGMLTLGATVPTFAATATDTVKVQWKVTAIGTLKAYANYSGTVAAPVTGTTAGTINSSMAAVADGTVRCSGGAVPGTTAPYLVDFGNVTPDVANPTGCLYQNAVAVQVQTNSGNWGLSESLQTPPAGFSVCALPNIGTAWPETPLATGTITTSTKTAAANLVAGGVSACPAGDNLSAAISMVGTGTGGNATTGSSAVAEDLGLIMPAAAAASATPTVLTLTFTLTYN